MEKAKLKEITLALIESYEDDRHGAASICARLMSLVAPIRQMEIKGDVIVKNCIIISESGLAFYGSVRTSNVILENFKQK